MSYSAQLPRYSYRCPPLWPPPSWEQVVAGLPLLPNHFLAACIAVLPVFTASVVLLDSAPSSSGTTNVVLAAGLTFAMAVFWWLFNRTSAASDAVNKELKESNKETKDAVVALTTLVTEMRLERKDDHLLTKYLKERQDKLETENKSLHTSVQAFDKYLYGLQQAGKNPSPPQL
jgi:ABC-type transport system involved in cytochrome bd biosynthesis fused ATPase/permease subunit